MFSVRCRIRLCLGAAGAVAAALAAGACSTEETNGSVSAPSLTVSGVATSTSMATSTTPAVTQASARTTAAPADAEHPVTKVAPPTTEMPVPTSTWVIFEEVDEPPPPRVFDSVRVPQTDGDVAGAMYWYVSDSYNPTSPPKRFEHAGAVFDRCRVEDAFLGSHLRVPISDRELAEYEKDWFRAGAPSDCRGAALAASRPLLDAGSARYFAFDDDGRRSENLASPQEALEWYRLHSWSAAESRENTLPTGAAPAGMIGRFGSRGDDLTTGQPWIDYSDADERVDEVRLLAGTVAVGADGALRGLVRNWSRTLWAYGTVVSAGGREWAWPLSIQPGEFAPFEIEDWDGPTDPGLIDFSVAAEMSNEADLSRAWYGIQDHSWYIEQLNSDNEPDELRYLLERSSMWSHPSQHGVWAPDLVLDLVVLLADLGPAGETVTEVGRHGFEDYLRWDPDMRRTDDGESPFADARFVTGFFPHPESWLRSVELFVDASDDHWVAWIGTPHPRVDR